MKKEYKRKPDERLYHWCFRLANDVLWNRLEAGEIYEILREVSQTSYFAGANAEEEVVTWRSALEKPEPDSYIIAADDLGNGEYEFIVGTYIDDARPWISSGQTCRMWRCIDRWCYASDFSRMISKVQR